MFTIVNRVRWVALHNTLARAATQCGGEKEAKGRVMVFAVSRRLSRRQTRTERDVLSVLRFDGEQQKVAPQRCSSPTLPFYPAVNSVVAASLILGAFVVSFEFIRQPAAINPLIEEARIVLFN